jgi:NADPH:quinone reductase-like Zn-dependent oxidoreductase
VNPPGKKSRWTSLAATASTTSWKSAVRGRSIGVLTGAGEINPTLILGRRASVQGMSVGSVEMFSAMNRAIAQSKLKPVIDKVYPFERAADAFRYMESAKHFGKIVVLVG